MSVPGTRTRVRRSLGRREDEEQQDVSCPALGTSLVVGLAAEDPPAGSVLGMETTSPPPRAPPGLMVLLKRQAGLGPDPLQVKIYGGICLGEGFITAFKRPRGCWGAAAPGGDLPCTAMQGGGSSHSPS